MTAVAFALVLSLSPGSAHAFDYTDIWFTPAESGWGVNLVQSNTFIFATFFIYGPDKKPTWYTAQLTWDGVSKYTGGLYLTGGSFFAGPWNPADSPAVQQVGTASFEPNSLNVYQGILVYMVTGLPMVTKPIERQTLTKTIIGGNYLGGQSGTYTGCTNAANNGPYADYYGLKITQTAANVATFELTSVINLYSCTFSGTLEQHGLTYRIPGATYTCSANGTPTFSSTATMYEIKATAQGVEGRFAASKVAAGCAESGWFSAVLQ